MFIYIDESGSFVPSDNPGSWCVVAALSVAERDRSALTTALRQLKIASGFRHTDEVKMHQTSEKTYLAFLNDLRRTGIVLTAAAVDAHSHPEPIIRAHMLAQGEKLREHLPKVIHPEGRAGYEAVADRFDRLSPQLYLQAMCQFQLILAALRCALLYFPQRLPAALAKFRWRVDAKDAQNSVFDRSFHDLAAPMLQSMTIADPTPLLRDADYSHLARFFPEAGPPRYLKEVYGIEVESGFSATQMMREDFKFEDSATSPGIQAVDLLASGLRRCLRGGFSDQAAVATGLGELMVEPPKGSQPIELMALAPVAELDRALYAFHAVHRMRKATRPMLVLQ